MAAAAATGYWLLTSSTFQLDTPRVSGELRFVDGQQAVAATLPSEHPNVMQLDSEQIREKLMSLPAIEDATVSVTLPNTLDVFLSERTPVFALSRGNDAMLIDGYGVPLALVDVARAQDLGLPIIADERSAPPTID
jgi:cell division septal protein FtsQ